MAETSTLTRLRHGCPWCRGNEIDEFDEFDEGAAYVEAEPRPTQAAPEAIVFVPPRGECRACRRAVPLIPAVQVC